MPSPMPNGQVLQQSGKPSRPVYLIAALVVVWVLGVGGVMNGCQMLEYYRDSTQPSTQVDAKLSPELRAHLEAVQGARFEVLNAYHKRMVPLAAANVLLSGLLIVACARALSGRPGAHFLALQAVGANMAYAVVDYFVSHPMRQAIIEAWIQHPPAPLPAADQPHIVAGWGWAYRLMLLGQLVLLALAAYALTRPRVLAIFQRDPSDEES